MNDQFPWEDSDFSPQRREVAEEWLAVLERRGPDVVAMILAGAPGSSNVAIFIGGKTMTRGFAEQWIGWCHKRQAEEQRRMQARMLATAEASARAAKWAAVAAIVSGIAAVAGAILAGVQVYHLPK